MSKDTLATEIALLKQSQQNTMIQLNEFKETEKIHHEELKELITSFRTEIKEALETKADKNKQWAEQFLLWVGGFIILGLLGYVGSLLVKIIEL